MNTSWVSSIFTTPVIFVLVVWLLLLTEAIFSPIRAFRREDFPAFVFPAIVIKTVFVISMFLPYFAAFETNVASLEIPSFSRTASSFSRIILASRVLVSWS